MAAVFLGMGKEAGGGGERQPVGVIGLRADPQPLLPAGGRQRQVAPAPVLQQAIFALGRKPCRPARLRYYKEPRAILPEREPAALADPIAGGARRQQETIAFGRILGRGGNGSLDGELHDCIQPLQGFVVGDVFLGL